MRGRRLVLTLGGAVALGVLVVLSPPSRSYLWRVTGEENVWEGVKGLIALVQIERQGPELALAPDDVLAHRGSNPFGVNTFLQLEVEPENVRRSLALIKDAGFGWVRQEFPWEDIEIHGRGDFLDRRNDPPRVAWEKYDRIVDLARDHHLELLVRLDNPPDWAFADPAASGEKGPPDDWRDFGNFVATVVGRYCGRIRYYQIWNEPNIYPEWGERDVDPAGYARLLALAAKRARGACPGVVIVSAALAQTTEAGGRNMDDLAYLEALYEAGWADDFDVLAVQAFGLWTGPTDCRVSRERTNFVRPLLARDIMVRHGDAHKPVWITEMGWDSPPKELPAPYGRVTEATRARYTVAAYERIGREWPWIGPAFVWFFRRPDFEWHQRPEGYFRLVEPDWVELPVFGALQELARRRPVVLAAGVHWPDDWGLVYAGPWQEAQGPGGAPVRVGLPDAELQFSFAGSGFRLDLGPAAEAPPPELYLVVDQEVRSAAIQALADRKQLVVAPLAPGEHAVKLRVDAGQLTLAAVHVTGLPPPSPLRPLWIAAWALLSALVVALTGLGWLRRRPRTARAD